MATASEIETEIENSCTLEDLVDRFGPMPVSRLALNFPALMGHATEEDLLEILGREKRLLELVDGFLLEKTIGWKEAAIAGWVLTYINLFLMTRRLGVAVGADGMYRLNPGLIRLPDVSFVPFDRFPGRRAPQVQVCPHIPTLAVEVLSSGNTRKEMDRKLGDYFSTGVLLVWYIDPKTKTAKVYTSPETSQVLDQAGTLDGGDVLPGFTLRLADLFDETHEVEVRQTPKT